MSGRLLDERQILSIVDEIKQVLSDILSLKLEREERTKAEYFDAEASDLIEIDEEEDLFHCICMIQNWSTQTNDNVEFICSIS